MNKADLLADLGANLHVERVTYYAKLFSNRYKQYAKLYLEIVMHIIEGYLIHKELLRILEARDRAIALLSQVKVPYILTCLFLIPVPTLSILLYLDQLSGTTLPRSNASPTSSLFSTSFKISRFALSLPLVLGAPLGLNFMCCIDFEAFLSPFLTLLAQPEPRFPLPSSSLPSRILSGMS